MPLQLMLDPPAATFKEKEIQGDVLIGLQKKAEVFLFFKIADAARFKAVLKTFAAHITTTEIARKYEIAAGKASQAKKSGQTIPLSPDLAAVLKTNIGFSATGIDKL